MLCLAIFIKIQFEVKSHIVWCVAFNGQTSLLALIIRKVNITEESK